jgi:hypothetical protein
MGHSCVSFSHHLICLIKKTKYTTRCSVKSSTIYTVKRILIIQLLVSKKAKLYSINLRRRKKIVFFLHELKIRLFSPFCNLIHLITKTQNIPQDAASKVLQFTKKILFLLCTFCFQKTAKLCTMSFCNGKN